MKMAALCDSDTAVGMRFAGITNVFIPKGEPVNLFYEIVEKKDIGVLFVGESLGQQMIRELKEYRLQNLLPIIVEIPDKYGREEGYVDFVSLLVKRAVGLDVTTDKK